ncbi:MAG: glycerate kinase [Candidatus Methylomirabilales bacterium]
MSWSTINLRHAAMEIFTAALEAVDPVKAIHRHLTVQGQTLVARGEPIPIGPGRVFVLGAGKASAAMAVALEELLGDRITDGVVTVKYGHRCPTKRISTREAGHPIPDEAGLEGARAMLRLLATRTEADLVIVLISGGGSALLPLPVPGVSLVEKQQVTQELLACGATIQEVNAVRKHLSQVKGGQLAKAAWPARCLSLILSDVIGDPLDAIASGPTAPDQTTYGMALEILDRYGIGGRIPAAARAHLQAGAEGEIPETPKPGNPVFSRVRNLVVANNPQAICAARDRAAAIGLRPLILTTALQGEAREVATALSAIAKEVRASGDPVQPPACLLAGGETTVTLRGQGKGGRNQEFVLAAACALRGIPGIVAFSGGTDGTDGPTDAAGGIVDGESWERADSLGLNPARALRDNDAYPCLEALGDLLKTGPTLTNVMDVTLFLIA